MRNKALIIGSIVYDEIFDIHGKIRNELSVKNGKVDLINLMFTANKKVRRFGGIAGNVAYGLAQQGEGPLLFSWVGDDFKPQYKKHCENNKIDSRVYCAGKDTFTAAWYGISDQDKQQIGIFQPNSYGDYVEKIPLSKTLSQKDFDSIKIASISPGRGKGMLDHLKEVKERTNGEAITILHPGQELSISFTKQILKKSFEYADIIIGNEIEFKQFRDIYDLSPKDILANNPYMLIETRGEQGSLIHLGDKKIKIPIVKAKKVVETTGAGDAFLSGFITGLLKDWPVEKCAKRGAEIGALSVAYLGGQSYSI